MPEGEVGYGMQLPIQSQSTLYVADWEKEAGPPELARIARVADEAETAGCSPRQLRTRSVAGAKLLSDEAALANVRASIQVHGGMGFTWEVPLHLHLKRARVLSTSFGTPAELSADLAAYA